MNILINSKTLTTAVKEINASVLGITKICKKISLTHPDIAARIAVPLFPMGKQVRVIADEINEGIENLKKFAESKPVQELMKN